MKNQLDIKTLKEYPIFKDLKENEIDIFSKNIIFNKYIECLKLIDYLIIYRE